MSFNTVKPTDNVTTPKPGIKLDEINDATIMRDTRIEISKLDNTYPQEGLIVQSLAIHIHNTARTFKVKSGLSVLYETFVIER